MFESTAEARVRLAKRFPPHQIEWIIGALAPSILVHPRSGTSELGGTRIGGTPDLPPNLSWPCPDYASDLHAAAVRSGPEAEKALKQHSDKSLPCTFVAQIDLAEAKALGGLAVDLPPSGRLLFFYDLHLGRMDAGRATAHVIWDQASRESLVRQETPASLVTASDAHRAELTAYCAEYGIEAAPPDSGTIYSGRLRPMALSSVLLPPESGSLEIEDHPDLQAALIWQNVSLNGFVEYFFPLYGDYAMDPRFGPPGNSTTNGMLGSPYSIRDRDPRLVAEAYARFGVPPVDGTSDRLDRDIKRLSVRARARKWRLLLQVHRESFCPYNTDGSIAFMIRDSDLADRRFDRVVVID